MGEALTFGRRSSGFGVALDLLSCPGYAKIAWTLEVEAAGASSSRFSTETRVMTTDPVSRERFRRYWAYLSPGILMIRYEILRLVKAKAERTFGSRPIFRQTP